jgi:hypothetical protein
VSLYRILLEVAVRKVWCMHTTTTRDFPLGPNTQKSDSFDHESAAVM